MEVTESWSARSGLGSTIFHLPSSPLRSTVVSAPVFFRRTSLIWSSGIFRMVGAASGEGLDAAAFWLRLDHQSPPPSSTSTIAATSRPFNFIRLPPAPPGHHPGADHRQREEYHRQPEQQVHLLAGNVQALVGWFLRPDGDE